MTIEAGIKMSPECATLFKALRGFMAECAAPKKTGFNPHFKSKYANLEEVLDTAKPVLDKHGLTLTQFPCGGTADTVGLATMLAHDSGQWVVATVQMPLSKRDPQAAGSAISYARRYSAMAVLGMAAEDDDGEQASGRGKQEEKPRNGAPKRTLEDVAGKTQAADKEPVSPTSSCPIFHKGPDSGKAYVDVNAHKLAGLLANQDWLKQASKEQLEWARFKVAHRAWEKRNGINVKEEANEQQ